MKTGWRLCSVLLAITLSGVLGEGVVLADERLPLTFAAGARAGCMAARGCFVGPELGLGVRLSEAVEVVIPVAFLHAPEASRWVLLETRPALLLSSSLVGPVRGYGRIGPDLVFFTGGSVPVGEARPALVGAHLGVGLDVALARFREASQLFLFGEADGAFRFGVRTPSTSPLLTGGYAAVLGARVEL